MVEQVSILIVDDVDANLLAVDAVLEPLGEKIVRASSGREALKILLEKECALILLDVQMPGMDGFETARLIRSRERSRHTPIIFLTAVHRGEGNVLKGYSHGAVDYIVKPFDPDALLSKVKVFIEQYKRERAARDQTEAVAKQGEDQLRLIADTLPALVAYVTPKFRYQFANRAYESWFGVPRSEVLEKTVAQVVGDAAFAIIRPHLEHALSGEPAEFEGRVPYQNGGTRFVRMNLVPQRTSRGLVAGAVTLVTDITEQKQTERHLKFLSDASAVLASSLDHATTVKAVARLAVPDLADWCAVDMVQDGKIKQVAVEHAEPSKVKFALELNARYPPMPDAPSGVPNVLRTGKPELYAEISDAMLAQGARDADHLRIMRALGLKSAAVVPITTHRGVVGAITLVTETAGRSYSALDLPFFEELGHRVALAVENATLYGEAQEAIQKRDEFLSIASHELRTPLTTLDLQIGSLVRAIQQGRGDALAPDKLLERLRRVEAQSARLGRLVNDLLDVARIGAGRLDLEFADFDLHQLAEEVAARFAEQATRAGSQIDVHARGVLAGSWDRSRLDQVLTNLLSNAIKYGERAPVTLTLEQRGGGVRILVRDRGMGISPVDQSRIFERFERAAAARHYGGIGLGLWITRRIVEAHGGTIRVDSRVGEGSCFIVDLPDGPAKAA